MINMSITFSSCFYIIKSKHDPQKYIEWMNNFISIVNNFNLVIYTDENSIGYIDTKNNPKIKVINKPFHLFYNYKYKHSWIENHKKNVSLNGCCWEINMLWSEKIYFVKETFDNKYFDTDFYGWCDIGYFRNRNDYLYIDTHTNELMNWPNINKINQIYKTCVAYACVNNMDEYIIELYRIVNDKNENGLPKIPIPDDQKSFAGGFFILYHEMIDWWFHTYDNTLFNYFKNDYLVKDDQIIIADCILSDLDKFILFKETDTHYDNWFMFQRILM